MGNTQCVWEDSITVSYISTNCKLKGWTSLYISIKKLNDLTEIESKIKGTVARNSTLNTTEMQMLMKEEILLLYSSITDFRVNIPIGQMWTWGISDVWFKRNHLLNT